MALPDITVAQIVALITAILGLVVSQGLITNNTEKIIVGIASIAVPMVLAIADSIIRHGRSRALTPTTPKK